MHSSAGTPPPRPHSGAQVEEPEGPSWALRWLVAAAVGAFLAAWALAPQRTVAVALLGAVAAGASGFALGAAVRRRSAGGSRDRDEAAVRGREERLQALMDNTGDAIIMTDLAGQVQEWNPMAERITGLARREALGTRLMDIMPDPTARSRLRGLLEEARHAEPPFHALLETRLSSQDGPSVPVEGSLALVVAADTRYLLGSYRDITERRKAEESDRLAFERLLEIQQLREMNRFKTQILNTTSHELNTPITPLKLQIHMLRTGRLGTMTPKQEHAVELLDRNVTRLADLVQDVLDVARLESGRFQLEPERIGIARIVQEAVETYRPAAAEAGLVLRVDVEEDAAVVADRRRIAQVLDNLLSNAVKFTPDGTVAVRTFRAGGEVVVEVADTGLGLDARQRARLFQPFSRVHDTTGSAVRGTGLGLYICKGIIEQHGGTIEAESAGPGQGSTFRFRLPTGVERPERARRRVWRDEGGSSASTGDGTAAEVGRAAPVTRGPGAGPAAEDPADADRGPSAGGMQRRGRPRRDRHARPG